MMKRKWLGLLLASFCVTALILGSCGKTEYKDGTYSGKSGPDDTGAWGEVRVVIGGSKIAECSFLTRQKDGIIKGEDYGKVNGEISNQDYYDKAQLAVRAMGKYAKDYVEKQNLKDIDAVSGATNSYNQFIEAVEDALEEAKK
jgi:major membrane immunogen (membrane-anchored lipoprotein)